MNYDARTEIILRNADTYGNDTDFRRMVDNTVWLTPAQREKSQLEVDEVYGVSATAWVDDGA
jgi:hypothetical protein